MNPIDSAGAHAGPHLRRLAGTFSIVARDPASGELGVGVQSHYFACGSVVPWAEPGVGAVATQAFVEVPHGPGGLGRLVEIRRAGRCLEGAIEAAVGGRIEAALELFAEARKRHPENPEYGFWAGISLAGAGRTEEARAWLREAFAADPAWRELARRLTGTGLLPDDRSLLAELEIE